MKDWRGAFPDWSIRGEVLSNTVFRCQHLRQIGTFLDRNSLKPCSGHMSVKSNFQKTFEKLLAAHSLPLKRSMLLTTTEGAVVMVHRLQHERLGIIFEAGCRYGEYKCGRSLQDEFTNLA